MLEIFTLATRTVEKRSKKSGIRFYAVKNDGYHLKIGILCSNLYESAVNIHFLLIIKTKCNKKTPKKYLRN